MLEIDLILFEHGSHPTLSVPAVEKSSLLTYSIMTTAHTVTRGLTTPEEMKKFELLPRKFFFLHVCFVTLKNFVVFFLT